MVSSPSAPLMTPSSRSGSMPPAPARLLHPVREASSSPRCDRQETRPGRRLRSRSRASRHRGASGRPSRRRRRQSGSTTPRRLASPSRLAAPSGICASAAAAGFRRRRRAEIRTADQRGGTRRHARVASPCRAPRVAAILRPTFPSSAAWPASLSHCGAGCLPPATQSLRSPPRDPRRRGPAALPRRTLPQPRCPPPRRPRRPAARHGRFLHGGEDGLGACQICWLPAATSSMSFSTDSRLDSTSRSSGFRLRPPRRSAPIRCARPRSVLDGPHRVLDAPGVFTGIARQATDVLGHDGEAFAEVAGARRFDRTVHRQHVGLNRDHADAVDDLFDAAADASSPPIIARLCRSFRATRDPRRQSPMV